jgi:hypothetical protein
MTRKGGGEIRRPESNLRAQSAEKEGREWTYSGEMKSTKAKTFPETTNQSQTAVSDAMR